MRTSTKLALLSLTGLAFSGCHRPTPQNTDPIGANTRAVHEREQSFLIGREFWEARRLGNKALSGKIDTLPFSSKLPQKNQTAKVTFVIDPHFADGQPSHREKVDVSLPVTKGSTAREELVLSWLNGGELHNAYGAEGYRIYSVQPKPETYIYGMNTVVRIDPSMQVSSLTPGKSFTGKISGSLKVRSSSDESQMVLTDEAGEKVALLNNTGSTLLNQRGPYFLSGTFELGSTPDKNGFKRVVFSANRTIPISERPNFEERWRFESTTTESKK